MRSSLLDINKLIKHPSRVSEDLGAIDLHGVEDIKAFIEEVMACNEEVDIDENEAESLLSDEPTVELKPLPSSLKSTFLDMQQEKSVIVSSQLDLEHEKLLLQTVVESHRTTYPLHLSKNQGFGLDLFFFALI